jgi:CheY-like chemotaxis protein
MIGTKKYHLILMDLQMPTMDGYETSSRIRALSDPYFKQVPIIALSADAMVEIRDRALQAGMTDFISKPFNPEELRVAVASHIQRFLAVKPIKPKAVLNFAEYSHGDVEFERQLAASVLKNLEELKVSIGRSLESKSPKEFEKFLHKSKTTLSIIGDSDFINVIQKLQQLMANGGLVANGGTATSELRSKLDVFESFHKNLVMTITAKRDADTVS